MISDWCAYRSIVAIISSMVFYVPKTREKSDECPALAATPLLSVSILFGTFAESEVSMNSCGLREHHLLS